MKSSIIGWKKQSPNEVYYLPNRQYYPQDSITNFDTSKKIKTNRKKVRFANHSSANKQQAFEDVEQYNSEETIFQDYDSKQTSSTNIIIINELSTTPNKQLCSVREITITFIIIVLIIIVVAIAIGIIFGVVKSSSNTAQTITVYTNSNSSLTTAIMTSSVSIGSQSGAPCSSYTTIDDPTRNVANSGMFGTCDEGPIFNSSNSGAWIRFVGSSGTIIALSPPGSNHCGDYGAIWLNSTLPTTVGTMINGTLCYDVDGGTCYAIDTTQILYCTGSFYIYFLSPVIFCNARYCIT
ncbi:unnamed protein product [Adineta steineri]|uniref:Uncharacterized protein n=1 Tax=Adineta steineri TaxID=433720 RepID=A0A813S1H5_9BILA|nr:unnamed protein product [Adineta steineri]CAF3710275.1 unnamed protein product [Adineta steineri]